MGVTNKVALVTGGSRSIGAAIAKRLAREGAAVVVNYRSNREAAEKVVKAITEAGGRAISIQADVQDPAAVQQMVEQTETALGPIDILVLNAARPAFWKPFVELEATELEEKLITEVRGFFLPARTVAPLMAKRGRGCIIGLSSALVQAPSMGFAGHSIAKAAVDGMLRSMALELAPDNVRVNTVVPSLVITEGSSWVPQEGIDQTVAHTPLGKLCTDDDVAAAVAMLAADDAGFITGAYFPVTGGMILQ